jgi:hypothetical protein
MSLKLSQRTVEETALGYDQIQAEKTVSQSKQQETGMQMSEGRQDRSFTNTSKSTRKSTQKANIGMRISFSIPITGTVPISGPGGTTNC